MYESSSLKKVLGGPIFVPAIYERQGPQTRPSIDSSQPEAQLPIHDLRAKTSGFLLYMLAPSGSRRLMRAR
jgi:hypothetical protein